MVEPSRRLPYQGGLEVHITLVLDPCSAHPLHDR
jgi:hypothetical protein